MPARSTYRPRPPAREFEEIRRANPRWPHVLAEGDSWFAHPIQWNILFHLNDLGGFAVRRLASIGDELADMTRETDDRRPQYVVHLRRRRFRWRFLLFSGGGRDLLGKPLPLMLRQRAAVSRWQDLVDRQILEAELGKIRQAYARLIERTKELRPECRVLAHGYDHPYPRDKGTTLFWGRLTVAGPWMQPRMIEKGITDSGEQRNLASLLIDRLNDDVLAPLATRYESFEHVDLRGTLGSVRQWDDEIHPKSAGFRRMARIFRQRMRELSAEE